METPELKPCPFCGTTDALSVREALFVSCDACIAYGPSGDTIEEAFTKWNTRAEVKAEEKGATGELS